MYHASKTYRFVQEDILFISFDYIILVFSPKIFIFYIPKPQFFVKWIFKVLLLDESIGHLESLPEWYGLRFFRKKKPIACCSLPSALPLLSQPMRRGKGCCAHRLIKRGLRSVLVGGELCSGQHTVCFFYKKKKKP